MNYNDYPIEAKQISWKPLAIIGGGLVVAGVIFFVVFKLMSKQTTLDLSTIVARRVATVEALCQQATNPQLCKKIQVEQQAVLQEDVELCAQLEGEDKDGCVWEVASSTDNASLCASLVDEIHQRLCADGIAYTLAVASGDPTMCDNIQDESKRSGCWNGLRPITSENCASLNQDPAYCAFLFQVELAQQQQDARVCNQFSEDQYDQCRDFVSIDDPDFDELFTYEEEFIYHTDSDNADTDGDGYLDGAEVQAGYNPPGPGMLAE